MLHHSVVFHPPPPSSDYTTVWLYLGVTTLGSSFLLGAHHQHGWDFAEERDDVTTVYYLESLACFSRFFQRRITYEYDAD